MNRIRQASLLALLLAVALHTYTAIFRAEHFAAGFWLWSLAPYAIGAGLLWHGRWPCAALGALALPLAADLAMHYAVFYAPGGSTAALGLFAAPLWNLVLVAPLGALAGWLADRRQATRTTASGAS